MIPWPAGTRLTYRYKSGRPGNPSHHGRTGTSTGPLAYDPDRTGVDWDDGNSSPTHPFTHNLEPLHRPDTTESDW